MEDCIFCKISKREIPSDIVYEGEDIIAFPDLSPKAPVHILIIPKKHIVPIDSVGKEDAKLLSEVMTAAKEIASMNNVDKSGFRLLVNIGPDSGQEIEHLHFHFLAGRKLGDLG